MVQKLAWSLGPSSSCPFSLSKENEGFLSDVKAMGYSGFMVLQRFDGAFCAVRKSLNTLGPLKFLRSETNVPDRGSSVRSFHDLQWSATNAILFYFSIFQPFNSFRIMGFLILRASIYQRNSEYGRERIVHNFYCRPQNSHRSTDSISRWLFHCKGREWTSLLGPIYWSWNFNRPT